MWSCRAWGNVGACAGMKTLKSKLARSGHAANLVGSRVVITGGILRDGSLLSDIIVIDLAKLCVSRCAAAVAHACALRRSSFRAAASHHARSSSCSGTASLCPLHLTPTGSLVMVQPLGDPESITGD